MRLKPLRKPSIILKKSKKHGWVLEKGASPQSTSHADGVPIPPLPREREREEEKEEGAYLGEARRVVGAGRHGGG
jgi:hypothetical protein